MEKPTFTFTQGFGPLTDEDFEKKKENETERFRILDGDGILYLHGYAFLPEGFTEDAFKPLDFAEAIYGATDIQYKNKETGKYETL